MAAFVSSYIFFLILFIISFLDWNKCLLTQLVFVLTSVGRDQEWDGTGID